MTFDQLGINDWAAIGLTLLVIIWLAHCMKYDGEE